MRYKEEKFEINDNIITIKSPDDSEAQQYIDCLMKELSETENLSKYPDEVHLTIEDELNYLGPRPRGFLGPDSNESSITRLYPPLRR